MAQRFGLLTRSGLTVLLGASALVACEAIAGYNGLKPWPLEAGPASTDSAAGQGGDGSGGTMSSGGTGSTPISTNDGSVTTPDGSIGGTGGDASVADVSVMNPDATVDAGPCPILTGNNACATVPRFTSMTQVVDGVGNEFCDIPAMVFDVVDCPFLVPSGEPPPMPETVYLRIAWSSDAFHLHVRVIDPSVVVNPNPASLWNGDAVEIFVAGTSGSGLNGSYNGSDDGGAIQIVLAPPDDGFPTRGQAFFNPGGSVHTSAPISNSIYAGRLIEGGYELELRFPWVAFADPAVPGAQIGFDLAVSVQQDADAGARQLQCIISDTFIDGSLACGYPAGQPAQPWCDNRSWCQPELLP